MHQIPSAADPHAALRWRRLFQFSLGTFLAIVTIACIALAVLAHRAREQRAAVERIRALGGSVSYDYEFSADGQRRTTSQPPGWPWLRRLVGDEYFQDVIWVRLERTKVSDDDLRLVGKLRGTQTLALNWTDVSDRGLAAVAGMRRLEYLGLSETQVTGRGLVHLHDMQQLKSLILAVTAVDDEGLESLRGLAELETLNLQGTRVTSLGVERLMALPRLSFVDLGGTRVDDRLVDALAGRKTLRDLMLYRCQISGPGLLKLKDSMSWCRVNCDEADLSGQADGFSNPHWQHLRSRLEQLNAERRLALVDLSGSAISDRQLADLQALDQVEMFDLRGTPCLTDQAVEALQCALPDVAVRR